MHREQQLLMFALVLDILADDENAKSPKGRLHSKTIRRTRNSVQAMFNELGSHARKAYRMSWDAFQVLHETLEVKLKDEFGVKDRPPNNIPT